MAIHDPKQLLYAVFKNGELDLDDIENFRGVVGSEILPFE